jgi:hypothetical protein
MLIEQRLIFVSSASIASPPRIRLASTRQPYSVPSWVQAVVDTEAVVERVDEFGDRYRIDFELATSIGQATIRSAWIIRVGEDFPRRTTCFVLPK